jgi:hypothetical protein
MAATYQACVTPASPDDLLERADGRVELEPFAQGTLAVARAVAGSSAASVVGGGDSVAAVNVAGVAGDITTSRPGQRRHRADRAKPLPGVVALGSRQSGRRPFVAGNWKMHKTAGETGSFMADLAARLPDGPGWPCARAASVAEAVRAAAGSQLPSRPRTCTRPRKAPPADLAAAAARPRAQGVLLGPRAAAMPARPTRPWPKLAAPDAAGRRDPWQSARAATQASGTERVLAAGCWVRRRCPPPACHRLRPMGDRHRPRGHAPDGRGAPASSAGCSAEIGDADHQYSGSMKPGNAFELLAQPASTAA